MTAAGSQQDARTVDAIKPTIASGQIKALLSETFAEPIEDLKTLEGGSVAQALSFAAGGREYVLRFMSGGMEASYKKEEFLFRNFSSPALPLPEVIRTGSLDGAFYGISRKMPGRGLKSMTPDEYQRVLPSLIETAYAIHRCDVSAWSGYGWIKDGDNGMFGSWKRFIAYVNEEERADGFFGKWHALFETTFLERARFDEAYGRMMALLTACPEDRYLVHGNYGYDNVLSVDGKVSAVLDWEGIYGDFAYDIAGLDFWPSGVDHVKLFRDRYEAKGMDMANYVERITCYKYYLGLGAMKFFAKANNREAYDYTCSILHELMS